ncbi:uncharacterized protein LOC113916028 [Zalophus californianus]|uniref:Uncharacterized protein LOC113916028 n=1 Tax=Zalophus californianus TaxID=9704 RepID=A0A6J2C2R8_ZALCA|nr:uncharacterized protein LOC113916028 [Zalophus californianus]
MAPPAPLARSLGLGADPPGRAPPAGCRRPTAQRGTGQRSPPPLRALPTPSAEARRRRSLREARPRWRAALLPAGLPLIQWMVTLLFCLRMVQSVPCGLSLGVPSELQPPALYLMNTRWSDTQKQPQKMLCATRLPG